MKNLKIIMLLIFIIIIILLISLFFILNNDDVKKKSEINEFDNTVEDSGLYKYDTTLQSVKVRNNFYAIKTCVEKFYITYSNMFTDDTNNDYLMEGEAVDFIKQEQQANITAVYNMLDEEYIQFASLTKENLNSKLSKIGKANVEIEKLYVSQQSANTAVYFVYGNLRETSNSKITNFSIILKVDMLNKTFKVLLGDYLEKNYPEVKIGDSIKLSVGTQIQNDSQNIFEYENISDEEYAIYLFDMYKKNLIYNKSRAYQLLDEEYQKAKYASQKEFEAAMQNDISRIATSNIKQYQKQIKNGKTQYVCIDQYQNYTIFEENNIMDYTVILDTYTIDLPEFTEKYNNSTEEQKVLFNVQKVFEAINHQDYTYAYQKLDETFKNNNFKTQADFEKYIKANFFEQNKLAAGNAKKQNDIYMYDITITDATGKKENSVKKTFVMQLKEGTDFVMSFSVN